MQGARVRSLVKVLIPNVEQDSQKIKKRERVQLRGAIFRCSDQLAAHSSPLVWRTATLGAFRMQEAMRLFAVESHKPNRSRDVKGSKGPMLLGGKLL